MTRQAYYTVDGQAFWHVGTAKFHCAPSSECLLHDGARLVVLEDADGTRFVCDYDTFEDELIPVSEPRQ